MTRSGFLTRDDLLRWAGHLKRGDLPKRAARKLRGWRSRPVDARLVVALVLLVPLWLAAAVPAVLDAEDVIRARTTADRIGRAVDAVVVELQAERQFSAGSQVRPDTLALAMQRARTDKAGAALTTAAGGTRGEMITEQATRWVGILRTRLSGLPQVRSKVDSGQATRATILTDYGHIIEAGLGAPWLPSAQTLAAIRRAREALAAEDALLRPALATAVGADATDRALVGGLIGARRDRLTEAGSGLADAPVNAQLKTVEDLLLLRPGTVVTAAGWVAAADPVNAELRAAEVSAAREVTAGITSTVAAIGWAVLIAGIGLMGVVGVLVLARRSAAPRARPAPAAAPSGGGDGGAPALEALLLDLHRRSQRLVHRQLRLLDAMERRVSDEETLGDLFRADHLAVGVRRNIEKAIALTGGRPGRRWRRPVPLVEVVRGAASEVPDYVRVSTARIQPVRLAGSAVTDVTHLLAELIDNATSYSPPETRVRVSGAGNSDGGYTVTIVDLGPGLSERDVRRAERVMAIAEPRADGTWRGFYAVGRFAARHHITVRLGPAPGGGLIAAVTFPSELLTDPGEDGPGPDAPPLSRVARMRARVGEVSDAGTGTVDLPKVGIQRIQSGQTEAQ
jgi:signal transduction histidine kinase